MAIHKFVTISHTALALVVVLLLVGGSPASLFTLGERSVKGDVCDDVVTQVISRCQQYVVGLSPPQPDLHSSCCALLTTPSSMPCLCTKPIPSWAMQMINKQAVNTVIKSCGLTTPPPLKCNGMNFGN